MKVFNVTARLSRLRVTFPAIPEGAIAIKFDHKRSLEKIHSS